MGHAPYLPLYPHTHTNRHKPWGGAGSLATPPHPCWCAAQRLNRCGGINGVFVEIVGGCCGCFVLRYLPPSFLPVRHMCIQHWLQSGPTQASEPYHLCAAVPPFATSVPPHIINRHPYPHTLTSALFPKAAAPAAAASPHNHMPCCPPLPAAPPAASSTSMLSPPPPDPEASVG